MTSEEMKTVAATVSEMLAQRTAQAMPVGQAMPAGQAMPGMMMPAAMMQPAPMPMAMMPAGQMQAPAPIGLLLRVTIPLPDGREVGAYLQFGPEIVANPQALPFVIGQLAAAWPIQINQPRNPYGGGYGGGGYGGGYPRNGYGRGFGNGGFGGGYGNGYRRY